MSDFNLDSLIQNSEGIEVPSFASSTGFQGNQLGSAFHRTAAVLSFGVTGVGLFNGKSSGNNVKLQVLSIFDSNQMCGRRVGHTNKRMCCNTTQIGSVKDHAITKNKITFKPRGNLISESGLYMATNLVLKISDCD